MSARAGLAAAGVLLALLCAGPAAGAVMPGAAPGGQAPVAEVPLPDPGRLSADWWQYFQQVEGPALDERISRSRAQLEGLRGALFGEQLDQLGPIISEIQGTLTRYGELRARKAPDLPVTTPPATEYGLEELLALGDRTREANVALKLEQEDAEQLAAAVGDAQGSNQNAKAAYLALPADAPERVASGLALMRDRVRLALASEELRLKRAQLQGLRKRAEDLAAALQAGAQRVRVDPQEQARFLARAESAQAESERLRAEAGRQRLAPVDALEQSATGKARVQQHRQRLVLLSARQGAAELEAAQARLAAAYLADLASPEKGADGIKEGFEVHKGAVALLTDQLVKWRAATSRERDAAATQLSLLGPDDRLLGNLQRARLELADETANTLRHLDAQLARSTRLQALASARLRESVSNLTALKETARHSMAETWAAVSGLLTVSLFELNETPVTTLGLLRVALILVVAWWVSKLLRGGIQRLMQTRDSMSRASLYLLQRLGHYLVLTVGFIIGLSSIGIDFTKFALFASALGVGIGFGLQAMISNFVAGLMILFEKSLKVGDFVELESGVTGEVRDINIRSTLITTNDNIDILVPNSEFVNGRVTNWTLREAHRRVRIPFGVAYGTEKELVRRVVLEAADTVPYTMKDISGRKPDVWLVGFGDSALNFELVVWLTPDAVKRPGSVHAAYTWIIETALRAHDIEIPFPQRDLHLRSLFGRKDEAGLRLAERWRRSGPATPEDG